MKGCHRTVTGMNQLEPLLSAQDLADFLDVPLATIYAWRYRGDGPPGFRVGRHLRFRRVDVEGWIEERVRQADRLDSDPTR
jgi:excisionase family DNA binding protein